MDEPGQTVFEFDECPVILECLNGSLEDCADLQVCDLLFARFPLFFFQDLACGKNKAVVRLIYIDDLHFDIFEKICLKILNVGEGADTMNLSSSETVSGSRVVLM